MRFSLPRLASLVVLPALVLSMAVPKTLAQSKYIFVLGSSTAQGVGASTRDSAWVFRFARYVAEQRPDYTVLNLGVGGYTTYQIVPTGTPVPAGRPAPDQDRNVTLALRYNPVAIIVNMPSNDAVNGYTVEEQLRNFTRIVAAAAAQNVPVWVATTQPRTTNLNDAGRANLMAIRDSIFARYGAKALDFWSGLALSDGRLDPTYTSGDGIHLNDTGHRLLFRRVVSARVLETLVGVGENRQTRLSVSARPNPFASQIAFQFTLASPGAVRLRLYNGLGREVAALADGTYAPGTHHATFDASRLPPGAYLYRLTGPDGTATGTLVHTR